MEDYDLLRHVTIGQYIPTGSILHRLDPRTKIISLGLLLIVLVAYGPASGVVAGLAVVLALVALSRVPLDYALGGLRPALPILLLLVVLQLFFGWGAISTSCRSLWGWWFLHVTTCSAQVAVASLARFAAMILVTSLLTFTTTTTELAHGAEQLMAPLQKIGVPAHDLSMVLTLTLRFVPTLAEELEKLQKAQAARGADISRGSNPAARVQQLLPVLVPLFITTLRRADELAAAMEARGYEGGGDRTHLVRLRWTRMDAVVLALAALALAAFLLAPFGAVDQRWLGLLVRAAMR